MLGRGPVATVGPRPYVSDHKLRFLQSTQPTGCHAHVAYLLQSAEHTIEKPLGEIPVQVGGWCFQGTGGLCASLDLIFLHIVCLRSGVASELCYTVPALAVTVWGSKKCDSTIPF